MSELEALRVDVDRMGAALWHAVATPGTPDDLPVDPVDERAEAVAALTAELEVCREERDRLRLDLAAVLASSTWRIGSLVTAAPRWVRDRRDG
jgi:hypothetical protein